MTTREEHLEWCKKRAREYIKRGNYQSAVASMLSDLRKHPETVKSVEIGAMLILTVDYSSEYSVSKFIEGFN